MKAQHQFQLFKVRGVPIGLTSNESSRWQKVCASWEAQREHLEISLYNEPSLRNYLAKGTSMRTYKQHVARLLR